MFLKKYKFILLFLISIISIFFIDEYIYIQKYENIGWEKGKNIIQKASINNGEIFVNIRDFDLKNGSEKYFLEKYNIENIRNIKYGYIVLNLNSISFVHNYFVLEFNNNKNFVFSIETRKHKLELISLKNSLTNKYNIVKIFSTENDLYSYIKKNNYKFKEFSLKFSQEERKEFFKKIIKIDLNGKKYNLFYRNCFNLSLNLIKNSFENFIFKQIYYYKNLEKIEDL